MVKKVLLLASALLFVAAGTAQAQTAPDCYPLCENDVTASDTTVQPGGTVTLTARTFAVGADVTFTLFSAPVNLGTVAADANGVATITATIPASVAPGTHTVEATGLGADGQALTVTQSITVLGAQAGPGLPTTGSNTTPMAQVALAAIAGGGFLVLMANKRRSNKRETVGV